MAIDTQDNHTGASGAPPLIGSSSGTSRRGRSFDELLGGEREGRGAPVLSPRGGAVLMKKSSRSPDNSSDSNSDHGEGSDDDDDDDAVIERLFREYRSGGKPNRRLATNAVLKYLLLGVLMASALIMIRMSAFVSSAANAAASDDTVASQRFVRTGTGADSQMLVQSEPSALAAEAAAALERTVTPTVASPSPVPENQTTTEASAVLIAAAAAAQATPEPTSSSIPVFDTSVSRKKGVVLALHNGVIAMGLSLIKELRCLGNNELVQVYHCLPDEMSEASRQLLLRNDNRVEIIDVCTDLVERHLITRAVALKFKNWWIKPLAMHHTDLEEPILMDADAVLLSNPASLRTTTGYMRSGTTFFYDRVMGCRMYFNKEVGGIQLLKRLVRDFNYSAFNLTGPAPSQRLLESYAYAEKTCHEQDSSMVLLNKRRISNEGKAMDVLWWLITRARLDFEFSWGDKESFWLAFELAHMDYFFSPWGAAVVSSSPNRDMEFHADTLCGSLAQYVPVSADDASAPEVLYVNGKAMLEAFPEGIEALRKAGKNNLYNTNPTHVVPRQPRTENKVSTILPNRQFFGECMVGLGSTPLPETFAAQLLRRRMFYLAANTGVEKALHQCSPFCSACNWDTSQVNQPNGRPQKDVVLPAPLFSLKGLKGRWFHPSANALAAAVAPDAKSHPEEDQQILCKKDLVSSPQSLLPQSIFSLRHTSTTDGNSKQRKTGSMKVAATTSLASVALVCALAAQQLGSVAATNCLAACQSEVMTHQVQDCTVWRERLPRPDLYSLCQDGFDLGLSAGCEGYCAKDVNEGRLASLRLDACTFLRGTPPMDRMRACQSGFTSAVKRAKDAAVVSRQLSEVAADSMDGAVDSSESEKLPKKKVTIKKTVEARNILELAREEAQTAFQTDTRATEL